MTVIEIGPELAEMIKTLAWFFLIAVVGYAIFR